MPLIIVLGCSSSPGDSSGSSSETSQDSGGAQTSPTTGATNDATPTDASLSHGGTGDSEDVGSHSASDSASTTGLTTGMTGTSGGESSSTGGGESSSTGDVACMPNGELKPVELGDPKDLGAAASYVLLAKTAITNATGSLISGGHVGLSPSASTFITGFAMVLHPSGVYSTSVVVAAPGQIYAANYALPTPTLLTTAVLGMQAAYLDAAGRVNPDYVNVNGGDIGGLTLAPGLYKWGSAVSIPNDVTLEGCADDVWIFQISNDLTVSAAKNVILSGGAQAKNVFWQVAGQATIQANAHFEGVLLSQTGITFQTTATLHGRALAQTMIALDDNAVTAP